jgi:hypothetical protein
VNLAIGTRAVYLPESFNIPLASKLELNAKLKWDPRLQAAIDKQETDDWNKHWESRCTKNANAVVSFKGPPGTGKSYAAGFFAEQKIIKWTGGRVILGWTCTDLLEKAKDAQVGDVLWRDEQTQSYGIGSKREQAALESIEDTCRADKISLLFVSPRPQLHSHHAVMESFGIISEKLQRGMLMWWSPNSEALGWVQFGKPSDAFLKRYEKEKKEFMRIIREQEGPQREQRRAQDAVDLATDEKYLDLPKKLRKAYVRRKFPNFAGTEVTALHEAAELEVFERGGVDDVE